MEAAVDWLIGIGIFQYGVEGNADDEILVYGQIKKGMTEINIIGFLI